MTASNLTAAHLALAATILVAGCDGTVASTGAGEAAPDAGTKAEQAVIDAKAAMQTGDCRVLKIEWHFTSYPGLPPEHFESVIRFGDRTLLDVWSLEEPIDESAVEAAGQYAWTYNSTIRTLNRSYACAEVAG